MFGGIFGGLTRLVDGGSTLGTGGDPTLQVGTERQQLKRRMSLPQRTTTGAVLEAAKISGQSEAQSQLLAQLSRHQLRHADNMIKNLETRASHSQEMMRKEQRVQQIDARYAKALRRYQLGVAENRENLSGFEMEMGRASEVIRF